MAIGIDLGGTKIYGVRLEDEVVEAEAKAKTPVQGGPLAVVDAIAEVVKQLGGDGKRKEPVGIGAPGVIDPANGVVRAAPERFAREDIVREEPDRPDVRRGRDRRAPLGLLRRHPERRTERARVALRPRFFEATVFGVMGVSLLGLRRCFMGVLDSSRNVRNESTPQRSEN